MRVLIVSDTHKRDSFFYELVERLTPDAVIHCGDAEGSDEEMEATIGCPLHIVKGNCDYGSKLVSEYVTEIGGYTFLIVHGHTFHVSFDREELQDEGERRLADYICFGHTHRPEINTEYTIPMLNPGSLSYPRQENHKPSYMTMEIEEGKEPVIELHYLNV